MKISTSSFIGLMVFSLMIFCPHWAYADWNNQNWQNNHNSHDQNSGKSHDDGKAHDKGHDKDHGHDGDRGHDRDHDRDHDRKHGHGFINFEFFTWPDPYYYNSPYYYQTFDTSYAVQPVYQPVETINGVTYFLSNGNYYIYNGSYYQPVAPPQNYIQPADTQVEAMGSITPSGTVTAVSPDAEDAAQDSFTVNIPNNNGGFTPVIIKKSGSGYTGPQGEFYPDFPKIAQLKAMYGG